MVASKTALSPSQFLSGNVSEICLVDGLARVDWQWFFSEDAAIALQIEKDK